MDRSRGSSPRVFRSVAVLLLILSVAVAMIGVGPIGAAPAGAPVPTFTANNPTCAAYGQISAIKVDPPNNGTYNFSIGSPGTLYAVELYNKDNPEQGFISFRSVNKGNGLFTFNGVIVKGGPNANFFYYPSGTTGDTGLYTPSNDSKHYGLSHVDFCYLQVPPTNTPTTTGTPTNTPTTTGTPTNTPTTTGTPTNTPTPTKTPPPGATNTPTPANTPTKTKTPQPSEPDPTNTPVPPPPPTATPVPPTATPVPVVTVAPAAPPPQPVLVQLPATGLGGAAPIDPPAAVFTVAVLSAIRLMLAVRGGRRDR